MTAASKRAPEPAPATGAATKAQPPYTGKEFLASLGDGREVWIYGERVKNITRHPAFQDSARMLARLYDALHEDHRRGDGVLTMPTDSSGFCSRPRRSPARARSGARRRTSARSSRGAT
jgi:4-hydroxyphenylacetate 3-monooxygenase